MKVAAPHRVHLKFDLRLRHFADLFKSILTLFLPAQIKVFRPEVEGLTLVRRLKHIRNRIIVDHIPHQQPEHGLAKRVLTVHPGEVLMLGVVPQGQVFDVEVLLGDRVEVHRSLKLDFCFSGHGHIDLAAVDEDLLAVEGFLGDALLFEYLLFLVNRLGCRGDLCHHAFLADLAFVSLLELGVHVKQHLVKDVRLNWSCVLFYHLLLFSAYLCRLRLRWLVQLLMYLEQPVLDPRLHTSLLPQQRMLRNLQALLP